MNINPVLASLNFVVGLCIGLIDLLDIRKFLKTGT